MVFGCVWIWDILWGCDLQYWHMNRDMYIIIICTMGCIKITFDIWELVRYGYIFKSVRAVMYTYKYISFSFWPLLWPPVVLWMVDQEFCSYCTCGEMRVCVCCGFYMWHIYIYVYIQITSPCFNMWWYIYIYNVYFPIQVDIGKFQLCHLCSHMMFVAYTFLYGFVLNINGNSRVLKWRYCTIEGHILGVYPLTEALHRP